MEMHAPAEPEGACAEPEGACDEPEGACAGLLQGLAYFIDFDEYSELSEMPRRGYASNPINNNIARPFTYQALLEMRQDTFFIFVSHCWMSGVKGSPAYEVRGYAHPDTGANRKHRLIIEGVEKLWKSNASECKKCLIWLDFGCIHQDNQAGGELDGLPELVKLCDCIFTPIVDEKWNTWELRFSIERPNLFSAYQAEEWLKYLGRAWCLIEMMSAALIPLMDQDMSRLDRFRAGLKFALESERRAHFIYGDHESRSHDPPNCVTPLLYNHFEVHNPANGNITFESDRAKVRKNVDDLMKYVKPWNVGYEGARNANGEMEGHGTYYYASGDRYEGQWKNDLYEGRGTYYHASGNRHENERKHGLREGHGTYYSASGDRYEGNYKNDLKEGHGTYYYAGGDRYEGEWKNDKFEGHGIYYRANGYRYEGEWKNHLCEGRGTDYFASGNRYEGEHKNGLREGRGILYYADGERFEGQFKNNLYEGRGTAYSASGDRCEGQWRNGLQEGRGTIYYADGDRYEGLWKNDLKDGRGTYSYADGTKSRGEYNNGEFIAQGGGGCCSIA